MHLLPSSFRRIDVHGVLANAGWLYLDQILRAVVVLVAFGATARHLGPAGFGVLSYALAFANGFLPLAMLGLDFVVVRDLVRYPEDVARTLGTAAAIKVAAGLGAWLLAMGAATFMPAGQAERTLLWIAALTLAGQPFLVFDFWFQSRIAARYSVLARMSACVLSNGLRLWMVRVDAPVAWFAWAAVVEAIVYSASITLAFARTGGLWPQWPRDFSAAVARRLWLAAWPLFFADLAMSFYLRFDQLILARLAGTEQLGCYAAAYRLADALEFFALALINSYFPVLVALHGGPRDDYEAAVRGLFRRMTRWSLVVAAAATLASPLLLRFVLGRQFDQAVPVFIILVWSNVFVTQIAVRGKWFLMDGMQVASLGFFVCGAVVHVAGVLLLAPRWGALGAAASFGCAQMIMVLVVPSVAARTRTAAKLALRSLWPLGD